MVDARALYRAPEGWILVPLALPKNAIEKYRTDKDIGPHEGMTLLNVLEQWFTGKAVGRDAR